MAKKIALDTNLMTLLVIGSVAPDYIGSHRRVAAFTIEDFELLGRQISGVELVLTPNALSEVSNLTFEGFKEPYASDIRNVVAGIINRFPEIYISSKQAANTREFHWLGLADTVWLEAVSTNTTLLTADIKLHIAAQNRGLSSINFNHLREEFCTI